MADVRKGQVKTETMETSDIARVAGTKRGKSVKGKSVKGKGK